jgi:flagellar biosynthesis/type III secretory pathway protein FliH
MHTICQAFRRYQFDRDFDALSETVIYAKMDALDPEPAPAPAPLAIGHSDEELAAACAEAREAGRRAALAEAAASEAARSAASLTAIERQLQAAADASRQGNDEVLAAATAIAVALCRKFLARSWRAAADEEISQLLAALLPRIADEPRLTVRVAPEQAEAIAAQLAGVAAAAGFAGTLTVLPDCAVPGGDCHLDWNNGGLIRSQDRLWAEVDGLLQAAGLPATAQPAMPAPDLPLNPSNPSS